MSRRSRSAHRRRWLIAAGVALILLAAAAAPRFLAKVRLLQSLPNDGAWPTTDGFHHPPAANLSRLAEITDENGVRITRYPEPLGLQYNPAQIANFTLGLVPRRDEPIARRLLVANLDHLLATAHRTEAGNLLFPYRFHFPEARQRAPWYSGLAQGQVASALLCGHRLTGDPRYLTGAREAIFALEESEYGLLEPLEDGCWLHEYPHDDRTVLDGSLAGIAGVYDLWKSLDANDPDRARVQSLLDRCVAGFKNNADGFDAPLAGHYFDDIGTPTPPNYHRCNLWWLTYLAAYDPELLAIRSRYEATDSFFGNALEVLRYGAQTKLPALLGRTPARGIR